MTLVMASVACWNKVGLDKEYANVDTQPSKVDVDTTSDAKDGVQNNTTVDNLDTKDSQADSLTTTPLKSEKAKK